MNRAFDRVLLARHFALSAGAVAAYVFREELRIGYVALWVVGISATLNFLASMARSRPSLARACEFASPVIGLGGWTSLVYVTDGVSSPFIAGLWLEIVLSAMTLQPQAIILMTVGSVLGLWAQQWFQPLSGWASHLQGLILQTGFLTGMGLATFLVTRRWLMRQAADTKERERLTVRLDDLTRELEDERVVAALGGNVARLAHGLKNAVHSLRGFIRLIEVRFDEKSEGRAALDGLRRAIDDLEELAHLTLGSEQSNSSSITTSDSSSSRVAELNTASGSRPDRGLLPVVERALREVESAHPDVAWEARSDGHQPAVSIAETSLAETLIILMRNAVEAMGGKGRALVETWVADQTLHLCVVDEGAGFQGVGPEEMFKPGFTTKPGGSGYGLFLAKRIVEEHGGRIHARPSESGGCVVEMELPLANEVRTSSAG